MWQHAESWTDHTHMHTVRNFQGEAMNLETPHGAQSKKDFERETSLCFSLVIVLMVEPSPEIKLKIF